MGKQGKHMDKQCPQDRIIAMQGQGLFETYELA
jgi:hypothetical protein